MGSWLSELVLFLSSWGCLVFRVVEALWGVLLFLLFFHYLSMLLIFFRPFNIFFGWWMPSRSYIMEMLKLKTKSSESYLPNFLGGQKRFFLFFCCLGSDTLYFFPITFNVLCDFYWPCDSVYIIMPFKK